MPLTETGRVGGAGLRPGVQYGRGKSEVPMRHTNIPKALRWAYKHGGQRKVCLEIINPGVISTKMILEEASALNDDDPVDREICHLSPGRLRRGGQESKKKIPKGAF